MEFERLWNDLNKTKITKYYLISVFAITFCITYLKAINAFYYLCLSFEYVFEYYNVSAIINK